MEEIIFAINDLEDFSIHQIKKVEVNRYTKNHLLLKLQGGLEIISGLPDGRVFSQKEKMSITDHEGNNVMRDYNGFRLMAIRYDENQRAFIFDLVGRYIATGILSFFLKENEQVKNLQVIVEGLKIIKKAAGEFETPEKWGGWLQSQIDK